MLAATKGVVGPTEQKLQEDGDKGDGLERRKQKPCKESKDLPRILPPCQQEQAWLMPATLATVELQATQLVWFSAYLRGPKGFILLNTKGGKAFGYDIV